MQIHTLDLEFLGVPRAIASYLVLGSEPVLIETGPRTTLETLIARLADHGLRPGDIRHVLVTHIHLDHAGALGWWAQNGARVYVHPVGAPHMIDPSRLMKSAARIYGDEMDRLWGEVVPAPEEQVQLVRDGDRLEIGDLVFTALDTPGHATHHHVYQLGDVAFAGDAAGIRLEGEQLLDLPAPPPEFDREVWHRTIDRLLALDLKTLYPTHFGPLSDARQHLESFRELISSATDFVGTELSAGTDRDTLVERYVDWIRDRALAHGASEELVDTYKAANPPHMSVDGIMRYWKQRQTG